MVSLFCILCGAEFRSHGTIPARCPCCVQTTRWTTRAGLDVPTVRYTLTPMDLKLLRALKIDPEVPPFVGTVPS